jgi:hypothetical protein
MFKRLSAATVAVLTACLLFASAAGASPYMQNQPRYSAYCGEFAASNLINWMTGAKTTGRKIFKQFPSNHEPGGASFHSGKRDLMRAIAGPYELNVQKFTGGQLRRGFSKAKQAMLDGGAIIMLAGNGRLTRIGHFVMGYQYGYGGKIAVSDSNRKNPDKWYRVSWLLNKAKGHVYKLWVYS